MIVIGDDNYYCYQPSTFLRNVGNLLEAMIEYKTVINVKKYYKNIKKI